MIWALIWAVLVGIGVSLMLRSYLERRQMPYRWRCELCTFRVAASSEEILALTKARHTHKEV